MSETRPSGDRDDRNPAASLILVAAVAAVLLAGLVLRTDSPSEAARESSPPPAAPRPALAVAAVPAARPAEPGRALEAPAPESPAPEPPPPGVWEPAADPRPPKALPKPSPAPLPAPPPKGAASLADRARRDAARLAPASGRYTAQLLLACQTDTVERFLAKAGTSSSLYVLPATSADRSCFRVVWGLYDSRKDAARAADLPPALRGEKPAAKSVDEALK